MTTKRGNKGRGDRGACGGVRKFNGGGVEKNKPKEDKPKKEEPKK